MHTQFSRGGEEICLHFAVPNRHKLSKVVQSLTKFVTKKIFESIFEALIDPSIITFASPAP